MPLTLSTYAKNAISLMETKLKGGIIMENNNNSLTNVANIMGIAVGGIQLFAMIRAMKQQKEDELEERITSDDVIKIARKVAKAECAKTADMLLREIKKLDIDGLSKSIIQLTREMEGKNK